MKKHAIDLLNLGILCCLGVGLIVGGIMYKVVERVILGGQVVARFLHIIPTSPITDVL